MYVIFAGWFLLVVRKVVVRWFIGRLVLVLWVGLDCCRGFGFVMAWVEG